MFSFEGRIRRVEYGITILLYAVFSVFWTLIKIPFFLQSILSILLLWFLLAQGAKRCHDIGKSGWWQIVPFFVVLWMLFKDGDVGFNEYG